MQGLIIIMLLTESLHSVVLVEMVADTMGETFKINSKTKKNKKPPFLYYILLFVSSTRLNRWSWALNTSSESADKMKQDCLLKYELKSGSRQKCVFLLVLVQLNV